MKITIDIPDDELYRAVSRNLKSDLIEALAFRQLKKGGIADEFRETAFDDESALEWLNRRDALKGQSEAVL
ncbi:hypothetical protein [Gordonibacter massiliensis (ex Traore et al. 2017)]|uniref:hypothetical protein n=1 Tax=Gordonibacter massiliensis (ex Traore et al. 2017) TaxID=1841863 RepID=UPI001C8BEB1A|nr:hypothetical protein [Gordonibacter massiliensis (ex Traore et al. 2017)]MBX9035071.1 hypothetical protein [Gordonibacter massiliensis (ex Traore et al. 2017)]